MFAQSIDTALAALYRTARHRLYVAHMEGKHKPTAAQARNLFVEFCYNGLVPATSTLGVPKVFQELGYIDPTKAKVHVPFQFLPPAVPAGDVQPPKPKPKARPKPKGNSPWHHSFPKTKQSFQLRPKICTVHVPLLLSLGVRGTISGGQNNIMHA